LKKPKRTIIMTTAEPKKELIAKWEKVTRVSDLAVHTVWFSRKYLRY